VLLQAHATMGNKWTKIAALLEGRGVNQVKNHWYSMSRRRKGPGCEPDAASAASAASSSSANSGSASLRTSCSAPSALPSKPAFPYHRPAPVAPISSGAWRHETMVFAAGQGQAGCSEDCGVMRQSSLPTLAAAAMKVLSQTHKDDNSSTISSLSNSSPSSRNSSPRLRHKRDFRELRVTTSDHSTFSSRSGSPSFPTRNVKLARLDLAAKMDECHEAAPGATASAAGVTTAPSPSVSTVASADDSVASDQTVPRGWRMRGQAPEYDAMAWTERPPQLPIPVHGGGKPGPIIKGKGSWTREEDQMVRICFLVRQGLAGAVYLICVNAT
jgi:hypothetical protein